MPLLVRFGTSSAPAESSLAPRSVKSTASPRTPKQWHTSLSNAVARGKATLKLQELGVSPPVLHLPASAGCHAHVFASKFRETFRCFLPFRFVVYQMHELGQASPEDDPPRPGVSTPVHVASQFGEPQVELLHG